MKQTPQLSLKGRLGRKVITLVGERIAAGETDYQLALELGVSTSTVRRARIAMGLPPLRRGRPVAQQPLTPSEGK